ncbi:hypothetical protein BC829DRAFT_390502 [Chytridium lagenaria]|nr:hypothetical protein BC829DRAFT_390502 [Chytridium lagenaria]
MKGRRVVAAAAVVAEIVVVVLSLRHLERLTGIAVVGVAVATLLGLRLMDGCCVFSVWICWR